MDISNRPGRQRWLARLLLVAGWLLPQTRLAKVLLWLAAIFIRHLIYRRPVYSPKNRNP